MVKRRKLWKLLPLARAIGVLSAVGIATSLVTFAAIQSTGNALTGNTIQTATAALQISRDGNYYTDSVSGFNFSGLVPGGSAQPVANNYTVYLKNIGSAQLDLLATVPTMPTVTGTVDLGKVHIVLTPPAQMGFPQTSQIIKLSDLIAGNVALGKNLAVGAVQTFTAQASMDADAVTGGGASITGLNLSFSGTLH